MYTRETQKGTGNVQRSKVILLRAPYPALPNGQAWPDARWLADAGTHEAITVIARHWGESGDKMMGFYRAEHHESGEPFMLALGYGRTPMVVAPLTKAAGHVLEGVPVVLDWLNHTSWTLVARTVYGPDSPLFDDRGECHAMQLAGDNAIFSPFAEHDAKGHQAKTYQRFKQRRQAAVAHQLQAAGITCFGLAGATW